MSPNKPMRVAALYRFAPVAAPEVLRAALEALCGEDVRGTLLVAREGVNGTIAGRRHAIARVIDGLRAIEGFADTEVKYADADVLPFHRLKVRVKPEIVTLGLPDLDPAVNAGTYVSPEAWNALIADPDVVVIDTRNDYEGEVGAFKGAVQPNTRSFRDFPAWFRTEGRTLLDRAAEATGRAPKVAMYCTGGIRCEKSTAFLKSEGVQDLFHLQGGILKYLETVPQAESLWEGECFVFDERVAVGHDLSEGTHSLCRGCRMPVSPEGRASAHYVEGVCCERCHDTRTEEQKSGAQERDRQVRIAERKGIAHIGAKPGANDQGLPGLK
ncbi:rhodanese-related sulfurtransferase [Brevundimonas sp. NIBR11]|uniref:oxygen-dependent tRNA uridine(34) hydroxylase TrhO n=1 Tax=Brevundimonas sp. NIBR11 TaxID=3015999 RepID=UPI0022F02947|nr:rhodanese-related sulfurtransferase [Brevundimonas sp. NIBR11]